MDEENQAAEATAPAEPKLTDQSINKLTETLDALKDIVLSPKVETRAVETEKNIEDDFSDLDLDDDQEKKLSRKMEQLEEKILNKVTRVQKEQSTREKVVQATISEYPDLKNNNSKLFKLADQIMNERLQVDPNYKNNPYAVYDCATVAAKRLGVSSSEAVRNNNINSGFTESSNPAVRPAMGTAATEITQEQRKVAERMGIKTDVYKQVKFEVDAKGVYRRVS